MALKEIAAANATTQLAGKNAIVTGGTSGIGQGIAMRLARAQASVTIVGRNKVRGDEIVAQMTALAPQATHRFVSNDAFSLREGQAFATKYIAEHDRLDYLVLSQGMATTQGFTPTPEGLDHKLCIHYFSRVNIINSLLPLLKFTSASGGDVRVLSILSAGVHSPYLAYEEDFELKKNYSMKNAADSAGFYNDLGLDALARANPEMTFIHSAPGFVNTNWGSELGGFLRGMVRMIQPLGASPRDCAEFMCRGLFDPVAKGGLKLYGPKAQLACATKLHDDKAVETIWKLTQQTISGALATPSAPQAEEAKE